MAESPDTPNVCPTDDGVHVDVVSAIHQFCNADWSDDGFNDWAEDLTTEVLSVMPAAPPAPGLSSPDVAALAERLRDWPYGRPAFVRSEAEQAADALEAQAARITELKWAMRLVVTGGEAGHRPMWSDRSAPGFTETPQEGLDPVGCVVCYPADGDWPCDTRMDINDLRAALDGTRHPRQETT